MTYGATRVTAQATYKNCVKRIVNFGLVKTDGSARWKSYETVFDEILE